MESLSEFVTVNFVTEDSARRHFLTKSVSGWGAQSVCGSELESYGAMNEGATGVE